MSVDRALEELYAGSPATFTSTRDRLAKELRASGDTEGAAAIAARHRPTQIAHVLNQLARRNADALAELVDVGRELARVQRGVLRGGSASGLREAIDRQRKVVADLTAKAAGVMRNLGIDPHDHLDAIATALHTALVDPAVGDALERGQLEKAPGAAAGFPGATAAEEAHAPTETKRTHGDDRRRRNARERQDRAEEERRDAQRRKAEEREEAKRRAAEKRQIEARERDDAKQREADERARRRDEAVAAANEAERDAKTARAAAAASADEAARARKEAARLAKEARALAADAKRLGAASKRAAARAKALGARTSS